MPAFARRSLGALRGLLSSTDELQGIQVVTTTTQAAGPTSLISTDLLGGLDSNAYRSAWVMPTEAGVSSGASAGVVRRTGEKALNTATGELALTTPFPATLPVGVKVEISTALPPVSRDRMRGLRECLNAALAELWMPVRLSLVGVNGSPSYDLAAYADWLAPDAIFEVYGPALDATLNPAPWPGFDSMQNANTLNLQVAPTFGAGAAIQVGAYRPGDTWIRAGSVWGESTTGLVADTDEQVFQPNFLVQIALQHAYAALAATGEQAERARWQSLADRQTVRANLLKLYYAEHDQRRVVRPMGSYASGAKANPLGW
jgi:hypothetical protein